MEQIRGNYLLINGKTVEAGAGLSFASTVLFYEVIRVMEGKLLFFEDHYRRFLNSVSASCLELPAMNVLRKDLHRLMALNSFSEGNIKILAYPGEKEACNTEIFFIPHSYPDAAQYKTGVVTRSYHFTRPDPSVKQWFGDFRRDVSVFIKNEGIYEAILSDDQGHLTEGSRSNLFFTDEQDRIITALAGTVLQGITKIRTEELCRQLKLTLIERIIHPGQLSSFRGCFLTGTSPKILPVRQLNEIRYDPALPVIRKLMEAYDGLVASYLDNYPAV